MVASPSRDFDGTTKVSFQAKDIGRSNLTEYDQARKRYAVSSFNVTFYHCARGSFWNRNGSVEHGLAEGSGTCDVCSDAVEGDTQVNGMESSLWSLHLYYFGAPAKFIEQETDCDLE